MDIWVLCYFLYDDRRESWDTVISTKGGGGDVPPVKSKKSMRGSFEIYKFNAIFNTILQ